MFVVRRLLFCYKMRRGHEQLLEGHLLPNLAHSIYMVAHGLVHARTNEHIRDIPVHGGPHQGPNLLEQRVLVPAHPCPRPVVVERPELSRAVRDDLVEDQTEAQLPSQTSNDIGFACSRRPPRLVSKRRLEGWKQNAPCSGYGVADNLPGAPLFAATELQPSPFAGMVLHRSSPEHRCRFNTPSQ